MDCAVIEAQPAARLLRRPSPLEPQLLLPPASFAGGNTSFSSNGRLSEELCGKLRRSSSTSLPTTSPVFHYQRSPVFLVSSQATPATHLPGIDRRDVLMTPTGPYPVRTPVSAPVDAMPPEANAALMFLRRNTALLAQSGFTLPPVQPDEGDAASGHSPTSAAILKLSKEVAADLGDIEESPSEATWSRRTSLELSTPAGVLFGPFCLSRATSVEAGTGAIHPPPSPPMTFTPLPFKPQVSPKAPPAGLSSAVHYPPPSAIFTQGNFLPPQPGTSIFTMGCPPMTAPPPAPQHPPPPPPPKLAGYPRHDAVVTKSPVPKYAPPSYPAVQVAPGCRE
mmetsp:Transcript_29094/g.53033  ORF Transcript_29094/g.53033 Transcript_29094/m.53033 type:complete len:336 (-) Transcript_29094:147-1154(-)